MTDIRVVADTNVIISGIFWRGSPYKVMKKALQKEFFLVTSTAILEEVSERLKHKFKLPEEEIEKLMDILLSYSNLVEPDIKVNAVKADEKDNKIIECALDGRASFIVTGDSHLLELKNYKNIRIITPTELLRILGF
ncbi:MAG: putative toxin-antitoxin system toxin component, PIN family [Candidatus Hydrothermarchaeales archaeon]